MARGSLGAACAAAVFLSAGSAVAQPAIVARVAPATGVDGWNNSAVTVTFRCEGVASCPAPVIVDDEGRDWLVTRSIVDDAGASASVRVTINIDRTAPKVVISSPVNDATTGQAAVSVAAAVTDLGSGVRSATCNGRPATLRNGNISCIVPLYEGLNGVIVQATDAAGNSGSTGIHVSRPAINPALTIVPGVATLTRGERRALQLVDVAGRTVAGAEWSVSNPFIATIERIGDSMIVRGLGPGTTTIQARIGQATAEAQYTVSPSAELPYGTTRWSMQPVAGFRGVEPIYTHPTPGGPQVITLERELNGRRMVLKASTATPSVLWVESPALRDDEEIADKMGEQFGGVLLLVGRSGGAPTAIVRAGRPTNGPLWRYQSSGSLARDFAQGSDGTVYIIETARDGFPHLLTLDGATGETMYRWPIPRSLRAAPGSCSSLRADEVPSSVSYPTVPDGQGVAFSFVTFDETSGCGSGGARVIQTLHLVRAAPSGDVDVNALEEQRVHVAGGFDRPPRHRQHVVLHQPVHAGDADRRQQAADRRRNQADEQRHQHEQRLRRARVDRERLQRDDGDQEHDRQAGEQDVERDLVRRLLPLGAFDERDHAIEEGLAGVRPSP